MRLSLYVTAYAHRCVFESLSPSPSLSITLRSLFHVGGSDAHLEKLRTGWGVGMKFSGSVQIGPAEKQLDFWSISWKSFPAVGEISNDIIPPRLDLTLRQSCHIQHSATEQAEQGV